MAKSKYNQISLKEKERIIGIMSRPENINCDCEKDFDEDLDIEEAYINGQHEIPQNKDKNLVERDEEEVDVEEAFINGEHRILVDPEYEYEAERRLNKQVKDRLSQLGLSPQTLVVVVVELKQVKTQNDLFYTLIKFSIFSQT